MLRFHAARPTLHGLERHLVTMYKAIRDFRPRAVVVDPITNFLSVGNDEEVKSMLMRLIDFLKTHQVTGLFTSLLHGDFREQSQAGVSSLMDTWLLLSNRESNGEHNRQLYLLKSRGMAHSNQVREFILSAEGIKLRDAYVGPEGVLTGSARLAQEAKDKAAVLVRAQDMERRSRELERKRREIAAQIEALQAQLASDEARRLVYGPDNPGGQPEGGTVASVRALKREDLIAHLLGGGRDQHGPGDGKGGKQAPHRTPHDDEGSHLALVVLGSGPQGGTNDAQLRLPCVGRWGSPMRAGLR